MNSSERTFPPLRGAERDMLNGFLQYQRDTLEWKCSALSAEQLKEAASSPSPLTLLGLLRHMTRVEYHWFENVLLDRRDHAGIYRFEENPDGDWTALNSHSPEEVFRSWKEACELSRRAVASVPDLDSTAARPWDQQPVMLRWIMVHMIEEYARHIGHADFLRERIDGQTGE